MKQICLLFALFFTIQFSINAQTFYTQQEPLPCVNKKFSIVAHTVKDSLGNLNLEQDSILAAIDTLNKIFEPICVSFEICEFNTIDNFQYDTINGNDWVELLDKFHRDNRINVFFATFIEGADDCGIADLGGIANQQDGGIAIMKGDCMASISKALPKYIGRFFGLLYTNEGEGAENVNGDNCDTVGDLICDTPADPYRIGDNIESYINVDQGCRFIYGQTDANGQPYDPHVANIMSFYPDECRCSFSYEQFLLMIANYQNAENAWW